MRTALHPQVEWQATLRTLDGTQTLVVSRLSKPDSPRASEGDLVLLGSKSDRWDLGCFVGEIDTWNGRMTRDSLDEDGRRNGVDGNVDGECSRMG